MGHARNFRDFQVWKDSVEYCAAVYKACSTMPWFEKKGLGDQIQRAAVSIPSNIAEGSGRSTDSDFVHFLDIALGSAYEVETQLLIAKKVGHLTEEVHKELLLKITAIERQLFALIRTLRNNNN